ncbi:MAG: SDR family oxidoreductase [Spirochaetes bacterium]|nr:SDR family oxidoreductase [Spirochaetota bacterium]
MKKAFVTGSTGFLGLNLIGELSARGWEIHALHLPGEDLGRLRRLRAIPVAGNILDYESLIRAIPEKVDAVFHLAGDTSTWNRNNRRQYEINVTGTSRMVAASIERGARRFVHTSSISAFGYHPGVPISEDTESNAAERGANYHITKRLAEEEVRKGVHSGLQAVILNPCNVLGPYDRVNWSQIIVAVHGDRLPGIPPGSGTFAHVRDVARAHIAAAEKGASGENYVLGGVYASFGEVIREIGALLGNKTTETILPAWKLKIATWAAMAGSLFSQKEPSMTPAKYIRLVGDLRCDDRKAVRDLGFTTTSLRTMLADSIQWLREENLMGL